MSVSVSVCVCLSVCPHPTETAPRGNKSQENREIKEDSVHLEQDHKDKLHGGATSIALLCTGHQGPRRSHHSGDMGTFLGSEAV